MRYISLLLGYTKTFRFNIRYLPLRQAVHFLIRIYQGFHIMKMKGKIILDFDWKKEFIVLGCCSSPALQTQLYPQFMLCNVWNGCTLGWNNLINTTTLFHIK